MGKNFWQAQNYFNNVKFEAIDWLQIPHKCKSFFGKHSNWKCSLEEKPTKPDSWKLFLFPTPLLLFILTIVSFNEVFFFKHCNFYLWLKDSLYSLSLELLKRKREDKWKSKYWVLSISLCLLGTMQWGWEWTVQQGAWPYPPIPSPARLPEIGDLTFPYFGLPKSEIIFQDCWRRWTDLVIASEWNKYETSLLRWLEEESTIDSLCVYFLGLSAHLHLYVLISAG